MTGVQEVAKLAEKFKSSWIENEFIPQVKSMYDEDKKGYNYRMCCISSLAAVMPFMMKD